jgi:hypothetical protein
MYEIPFEQESQATPNLLKLFEEYVPNKPYCTNQLGHLLIRPKKTALKHAYIQFNPIHRAYWFAFDIDTPEMRYWVDEHHIPCPNMSIINRKNNHSHAFYLIDPAVYTLRQAHKKPLELAADVDRGLTTLLGADPGYGKLITKNPFCREWLVVVWHEKEWSLTELLDYIPQKILKEKRTPREELGVGRNCTVFEKSRHYAYSQWRRQKFEDYQLLFNKTYEYAQNINYDFLAPMTDREVVCIVRSISRWTAKHHSAIEFSQIQRARGLKGNLKSQIIRGTKAELRAEEIIAYKDLHPHMSNRMIAEVFDVSEYTIRQALKC